MAKFLRVCVLLALCAAAFGCKAEDKAVIEPVAQPVAQATAEAEKEPAAQVVEQAAAPVEANEPIAVEAPESTVEPAVADESVEVAETAEVTEAAEAIEAVESIETAEAIETVKTAEAAESVQAVQAAADEKPANAPKAAAITMPFTDTAIKIGDTLTLEAETTPKDAKSSLTYKSGTPGVLTVSADGVVKAVGYGKSLVTISSGGVSTSVTIYVPKTSETIFTEEDINKAVTGFDAAALSGDVLRLVNKERAAAGLKALANNAVLGKIAFKRANEVSKEYSHKVSSGGDVYTDLDDYGFSYDDAGENLGSGSLTAASAVDVWLGSEMHRKNVLSPAFKEAGVGVVIGDDGVFYWALVFIG